MGSTIQPKSSTVTTFSTRMEQPAVAPPPPPPPPPAKPLMTADGFDAQPRRKASVNLTGGAPVVVTLPPVNVSGGAPASAPSSAPASAPSTYTVKEGDTGYSIAKALGVSIQALREANPTAGGLVGGSGQFLQVGQQLNIPGQSAPQQAAPVEPVAVNATPVEPVAVNAAPVQPVATNTATTEVSAELAPVPLETYTVKEGDTGSGIAAELGVSIQALREANPEAGGLVSGSGQWLNIGQTLNVPPPPPPPLAQAPAGSPDLAPSQAMVDSAVANQALYGEGTANETRYDERCLEFVAHTATQANGVTDPILSQGNAAGALYEAQRQGRLYADFSQMPAGAAVFWEATGANGNEGHVAIFSGRFDENNDPIMLTSTGFGANSSGIQEMPLSRLNDLENIDASGWMMPRGS